MRRAFGPTATRPKADVTQELYDMRHSADSTRRGRPAIGQLSCLGRTNTICSRVHRIFALGRTFLQEKD